MYGYVQLCAIVNNLCAYRESHIYVLNVGINDDLTGMWSLVLLYCNIVLPTQ